MDLPDLTDEQRRRIICIGESYQRLTGRPLVLSDGDPVEALWSAPFAIVSHGTEPDPILAAAWYISARRAGLRDFEMDDFLQGLTPEQQKQAIERANRLR